MWDSSSRQISQWSTANIHHNPSIKSKGDRRAVLKRQLLYLGCGTRAHLRGVALHPKPQAPFSLASEAILILSIIIGTFPGKLW